MGWTLDDIRDVNLFLGNMATLLKDCPEKLPEFAPVLTSDCKDAQEAFHRIADTLPT
jgi:hypothetical protein